MFIDDSEAIEFGRRIEELPEERILYDYVQAIARRMPHESAIDDFYRLLFDGNSYPKQDAKQALKQILDSPQSAQTGKFVLNRLFYIMGNTSVHDPHKQEALFEVITRIAKKPPPLNAQNPFVKKLRKLAYDYVASDLYLALQWQMKLLRAEHTEQVVAELDRPLGNRVRGFFFLQEALATTRDIPASKRIGIRKLQAQQARALDKKLLALVRNPNQIDQAFVNSMSLSYQEIRASVDVYRPKQNRPSIDQEAHNFYDEVRKQNLGYLRQKLFRFLLEPLAEADARFNPDSHGHFQAALKDCLKKGLADKMSFNQVEVTRIGENLLKFLITKSLKQPSSPYFQQLLRKAGHMAVTKMLLRLTLFFPKLRFCLSERFAILFHVHQKHRQNDQKVNWLVRALDHLNIGLA
ncbi:MAG: hypothetical protein F6K42_08105, partial [Leptolyngbya sp. SIO1D8]|nr:hypothetical protein [Leptolyngbya sp. SIO1D8]